MKLGFHKVYKSKKNNARVGELRTAHGVIKTPAFVPVGTQATVKGLTPDDLKSIGTQCVLANTYHLYLRPGADVVAKMGGLHSFMSYGGPIFTDSGGFQVFSLGIALEQGVGKLVDLFADDSREENSLNKKILKQVQDDSDPKQLLDVRSLCKVDDEGSTFMSHLDGTLHRWTAEKAMQIQSLLGADLLFALDECTSPLHDYEYTKKSMKRSHDWEKRSLEEFKRINIVRRKTGKHQQLLYGIVQGGPFEDLRKESAKFVAKEDFDGVSIGGALVSKKKLEEILGWVMPELPERKSRHLLGIGEIDDLFMGVKAGIDTFDCAHPTRIARRGNLYISPQNGGRRKNRWRIGIGKKEFETDVQPIDPGCDCYTCTIFTRAYLRHLFWARELTYYRLATIHNLRFVVRLMERMREAVKVEKFDELEKEWLG